MCAPGEGGLSLGSWLAGREGTQRFHPSTPAGWEPTASTSNAALGWSQESVSEDDECSFQPCCEAEEILGYKDESRYSGCDGAALPA